jgi:hypothetical protein
VLLLSNDMQFENATCDARFRPSVDFPPGVDHWVDMPPGEQERNALTKPLPAVLLSSNSFWNIINFRGALVAALVAEGYPVRIAAPDVDAQWAGAAGAEATEIAVDRSGLNPIIDAVLWLNYMRLFRREKSGYFLGFTAKPNIYGCLAAQISGVKSIPNVSGLGTAFMKEGLLSRLVMTLYRLAFRRSPIVFFQKPGRPRPVRGEKHCSRSPSEASAGVGDRP